MDFWDYDNSTYGDPTQLNNNAKRKLYNFYFFSGLSYPFLLYYQLYDDYYRKRLTRKSFAASYDIFESIKAAIGDKGMKLGSSVGASQRPTAGDEVGKDNISNQWVTVAKKDFFTSWTKTSLGDYSTYGHPQCKEAIDNAIKGFQDLAALFKLPEYGVTRIWLLNDRLKGPYSAFNTCLIKTEDDAKKLFGFTPKDNPNEAEIISARAEARKVNINLSYKSTKSLIKDIHKEGTPLAFAVVPNDIKDSEKDKWNHLYVDTDHDYIKNADNTDIEKLDYLAKRVVRQPTEKSLHAVPKGKDDTIVGSAVGIEIPNQADELEAMKLQQTPPEREVVDKEAILAETEAFLEAQNAGLNSTSIQGIVVNGQLLEETDEAVGVGICYLKEVISGVTQSATYSSSIDGRISIPEFGKDSIFKSYSSSSISTKRFWS